MTFVTGVQNSLCGKIVHMFESIVHYFSNHSSEFFVALWQHVLIASIALVVAFLIAFPLGVLSAGNKVVRSFITGIFSTLRVIPSLALLFLIVVLTGSVGFPVAAFALTVLAVPPILINTTLAFSQLPTAPLEAARALGLTRTQTFWRIKVPLAAPLLFAGAKTAATEVIASATLAAFVGGGGLGTIIFTGLGLMRNDLLVIGGFSVAILSLTTLALLNLSERRLIPWFYLDKS